MNLSYNELSRHLREQIAERYLIFGSEPFLNDTCTRAIREKARNLGFSEKISLTVTADFNWIQLNEHLDNQSLFADKKLIEIRFTDAIKPGTQGGTVLRECLGQSDENVILMVSGGEIEYAARRSKWFTQWQQEAVIIETKPLGHAQYRSWIQAVMHKRDLKFEPQVPERLAYYFEGNMLAAANEVRKLALGYDGQTFTVADVERIVADQGRFSVYGLTDSLLAFDLARTVRQINGLRKEGIAPAFISWALLREMRLVYRYAFVAARRLPAQQFFRQNRIWQSRQNSIVQTARKLGLGGCGEVVGSLAAMDRIIKGREPGRRSESFWDELEKLAQKVCV